MRSLALTTRWCLVVCRRTGFFWAWNIIVLVLILSLQHITHFELDRSGALVHEFFLSTLVVAAAVNSIGFQLQVTLRRRAVGEWRVVLSRPCSAASVVGGLLASLLVLELVVAAALVVVHLAVARGLGRDFPPLLAESLAVTGLKVAALCGFHVFVSVALRDTWALIAMVGGYLLGQLSEPLYRATPEGLRVALDVVYCVIPDLTPLGYLEGAPGSSPALGLAVLQTALQVGLLVAASALLLAGERSAAPSAS